MKMRSYLLGAMVTFTLLGIVSCATKPIPVVYQCPVVKLPPEPVAHLSRLTNKSRPDQVLKAYVADLSAYKGWCHAVQKQVNG